MVYKLNANKFIYTLQNFEPMTFSELRDKFFANYEAGAITDANLVQIIEKAAMYLNLQTLTNYAASEKITYNGAKKRNLQKVKIDNVEFVINNE